MKFRIEAGTNVICRRNDSDWRIRTFHSMDTDVVVTFSPSDLWFVPSSMVNDGILKPMGSGTEALLAANFQEGEDKKWYRYTIQNFFGFNLPKNKKNIDQIIVNRKSVQIIDAEVSQINRDTKTIRRLNKDGKHFFPGYIPIQ